MNKKLGYYVCNGQEFDSKIRCFIYATEVKQPVTWIFNDEVFNNANWQEEPEESLDSLYDRRARELREKYDYIILSYSGGSDSNNILMSFYRQGLRIDEIVTNWVQEASKAFTVIDPLIKCAWNHHAEYELHTRARLQWITDNMPSTKITFFDCSRPIIDYFKNVQDKSWILNHREPVNPAVVQRFNYLQIKDLHHRVDRQKNMAIIVGVDKPRLYVNDTDQLILFFHDKLANIIPTAQHFTEYDNSTIELFYWAPESADILRKQAHLMYKFLQMNAQYRTIYRYTLGSDRNAQEVLMKNVLYSSTWDNRWFQTDKSMKDWDNELDTWFYKQFNNTKLIRNWNQGIDYLEKNISVDLLNDKDKHSRGLKTFKIGHWTIGQLT
jgi:hypothetical protein